MTQQAPEVIDAIPEDPGLERAGRRSAHPSSSDGWERREEAERVSKAIAVLPPELQRKLADPRAVISPLMIAEQAKDLEAAYQALFSAILTDDDYSWYVVKKQRIVGDGLQRHIENYDALERRKRKSAWRKGARYINADTDVSKEVIGHAHTPVCSRIVLAKAGLEMLPGEDCACPTVYARYHITVTGWNGRKGFGVGIASSSERGFKAADHSIPATAYTRALSRAISDVIGAGEGDADDPVETTDAPKGEQPARPATPDVPLTDEQLNAYTTAWKAGTQDQRRNTLAFLKEGDLEGNFVARGGPAFRRVMELLGAGNAEEAAPR